MASKKTKRQKIEDDLEDNVNEPEKNHNSEDDNEDEEISGNDRKPRRALGLDIGDQNLFLEFLHSLPEKSRTVRIFSRDDYYTVHENDAIIATEIHKSLVAKTMGDNVKQSKYLVLNSYNFKTFLRELLLVKQYRVEVYTKESASGNDWTVEYKGSPGNLVQFESILFGEDILVESLIIAIKIVSQDSGNREIGFTCLDQNTATITVCEFNDNELFTDLEALIVQLAPKECLIAKNQVADMFRIETIMTRNNVLLTKLNANDFSSDNLITDLNRLIYFEQSQLGDASTLPVMKKMIAPCGVAALIKYLDLMSIETNFNQFKIVDFNLKEFVHVDGAAISGLNILPPQGREATELNCVLGCFDACSTSQGHRLLAQWFKQPLRDLDKINERHDIVEAFYNNTDVRNTLNTSYLKSIPDLQAIVKKIMHKKATLQDCYRIYQTVKQLRFIVRELMHESNKGVHTVLIEPLEDSINDMAKFQEMIEQTIDLDAAGEGKFLIRADFDETLVDVSSIRIKLEEEMSTVLSDAAHDLGLDQKLVKLESCSQHGYCFRVTLQQEQCLRSKTKYEILDVKNNGVRFTNKKLKEINREYDTTVKSHEEQQKKVVDDLLSVAATFTSTIININSVIALIDVFIGLAQTAANAAKPYVRPQMLPEGSDMLYLKQVRHPCIELNKEFVANDCYFKREKEIFQVITGANMGGKSTYIRSIGVSVLLAHIGAFVPCEKAAIPIFSAILARIGAHDDENRGHSTFMVEMIETSGTCQAVNENSLVLIDELGRGTSTYEGAGIAWAVAEYLIEKKAFTVFATHFHELTYLADEFDYVVNKHVAVHHGEGQLTFLYEIRNGACAKSYGLPLAKIIGFPNSIIYHAAQTLTRLDPSVNMDSDMDAADKRKYIKEGKAYIKSILERIQGLEKDQMSEEEYKKTLDEIKNEIKTHSNPFMQAKCKTVENYLEYLNNFKSQNGRDKFKGRIKPPGLNEHMNGNSKPVNGNSLAEEELNGIGAEAFDDDF